MKSDMCQFPCSHGFLRKQKVCKHTDFVITFTDFLENLIPSVLVNHTSFPYGSEYRDNEVVTNSGAHTA